MEAVTTAHTHSPYRQTVFSRFFSVNMSSVSVAGLHKGLEMAEDHLFSLRPLTRVAHLGYDVFGVVKNQIL